MLYLSVGSHVWKSDLVLSIMLSSEGPYLPSHFIGSVFIFKLFT